MGRASGQGQAPDVFSDVLGARRGAQDRGEPLLSGSEAAYEQARQLAQFERAAWVELARLRSRIDVQRRERPRALEWLFARSLRGVLDAVNVDGPVSEMLSALQMSVPEARECYAQLRDGAAEVLARRYLSAPSAPAPQELSALALQTWREELPRMLARYSTSTENLRALATRLASLGDAADGRDIERLAAGRSGALAALVALKLTRENWEEAYRRALVEPTALFEGAYDGEHAAARGQVIVRVLVARLGARS